MRSLSATILVSALTLLPSAGGAADAREHGLPAVSSDQSPQDIDPRHELYRGYYIDLSDIAGHRAFKEIETALRQQVDIAEGVGLSARVLKFFQRVPIVVDELACMNGSVADSDGKSGAKKPLPEAACYGRTAFTHSWEDKMQGVAVWDSSKSQWDGVDPIQQAETESIGVVSVRPNGWDSRRPILLHEMLHAYHANVLPQGFKNPGILFYYNGAKDGGLYPAGAYLMTNEKEFFAVTGSVFLFGQDGPRTRSELKQKQPEYYQYLVWLFGFDPDRSPTALDATHAPASTVN